MHELRLKQLEWLPSTQHITVQDLWTEEQSRKTDWEPSNNIVDAQQLLDSFETRYDELHAGHQELVSRGRRIADEIVQLDSVLFGGPGGQGGSGVVHPAVVTVNELVRELEQSVAKLERVASPKLQQLRDCLQFYLLQQRANKVRRD